MRKIEWDILVGHLTGTSSAAEEEKLTAWISESDEHRILYERIRKLWSTEPRTGKRPDTERALSLVLSRIQQSDAARKSAISRQLVTPAIKRPFASISTAYILRAAAVLFVAVGAIYVYTLINSNRDTEQASVTFSSMQSLRLPDGTKVTFDVGSSFTYPKAFGSGDRREVSLKGEAFFEVARDEKKPFVIHADGGRIEVLGTKFNVRAWGTDDRITVAVQEGRVSFQSENNRETQNVVYLAENNLSRLSRGSNPSAPEHIDISSILSWMRKEIYFRNAPVPEVLHQLQRWYGVTIESTDTTFLKSNITVFIENKPLVDNLNLIDVTMNVRHEQHGSIVQFLSK